MPDFNWMSYSEASGRLLRLTVTGLTCTDVWGAGGGQDLSNSSSFCPPSFMGFVLFFPQLLSSLCLLRSWFLFVTIISRPDLSLFPLPTVRPIPSLQFCHYLPILDSIEEDLLKTIGMNSLKWIYTM